jgi:WD40 repeat protein
MAVVLSLPEERWRSDGQMQSKDQEIIELAAHPKYQTPSLINFFMLSSTPPPTVVCCESSLASHPFRELFALKYDHTIYFHLNKNWSEVSLRIESRVTSLEWDHLTDRLFVGTAEKGIIIYKFTGLEEDDLSQYSSTAFHPPLPPAFLSLIAAPMAVHSLKSCPRGRFLAVLSSSFASGWSYREITLWDCYSSTAPTPLMLPGYGWKHQRQDEQQGGDEGLCCLEWSPTGLYLAAGARSPILFC